MNGFTDYSPCASVNTAYLSSWLKRNVMKHRKSTYSLYGVRLRIKSRIAIATATILQQREGVKQLLTYTWLIVNNNSIK